MTTALGSTDVSVTADLWSFFHEAKEYLVAPLRRSYRYYKVDFVERVVYQAVPAYLLALTGWLLMLVSVPQLVARFALTYGLLLAVLTFAFLVYVYQPYVRFAARGVAIDREMHLFITRMGVLSTSEASRREMLEVFGLMQEYGELAAEMRKIHTLVTRWNMSLERSIRSVAEDCPSELFADFLSRLALGVETGETAEEFFRNEQIVVMDQYAIRYESAMRAVEQLKELYIALTTAMLFIIVVVAITPFIVPSDITTNLWLSIGLFLLFEAAMLYLLYALIPGESIWSQTSMRTAVHAEQRRRVLAAIPMMLVVFLPLAVLNALVAATEAGRPVLGLSVNLFEQGSAPHTWFGPTLPWELVIAATITPLLYPSLFTALHERRILRRDSYYPSFIRSLGSGTASSGRSTAAPVRRLRLHDFGPLNVTIGDLAKRLGTRIGSKRAWEFFAAETLSELIAKFNEMYVEGVRIGGDGRRISRIISGNFIRILGLRRLKQESASTFTWMLYGLTVSTALVLYFILYLIQSFHEQFVGLTAALGSGTDAATLHSPGFGLLQALQQPPFDFGVFHLAIFLLLIAHAAITAVMTRVVSGGHPLGGLTHFVGMTWAATITALVVTALGNSGLIG